MQGQRLLPMQATHKQAQYQLSNSILKLKSHELDTIIAICSSNTFLPILQIVSYDSCGVIFKKIEDKKML